MCGSNANNKTIIGFNNTHQICGHVEEGVILFVCFLGQGYEIWASNPHGRQSACLQGTEIINNIVLIKC